MWFFRYGIVGKKEVKIVLAKLFIDFHMIMHRCCRMLHVQGLRIPHLNLREWAGFSVTILRGLPGLQQQNNTKLSKSGSVCAKTFSKLEQLMWNDPIEWAVIYKSRPREKKVEPEQWQPDHNNIIMISMHSDDRFVGVFANFHMIMHVNIQITKFMASAKWQVFWFWEILEILKIRTCSQS